MNKRAVNVVVISDVHLGTYGSRAKELLTYLRSVTTPLLILNGDIIDMWQFSKRYFPSSHLLVIREIINMIAAGTRVVYITGNHDETLRRYTDLSLGKFQLTDKLLIEIDGKMHWFFHGDAFDISTKNSARFWAKMGSNGYAVLLAFNRLINKGLELIGREKFSLSARVMNKVNKAIIRINDFETIAAELAIEKKYDYVICGHIHQPQIRKISNQHGEVTYLNSGDWIENLTALEYSNNKWQIYTYCEEVVTPVEKTSHAAPNVIPDNLHHPIELLFMEFKL